MGSIRGALLRNENQNSSHYSFNIYVNCSILKNILNLSYFKVMHLWLDYWGCICTIWCLFT